MNAKTTGNIKAVLRLKKRRYAIVAESDIADGLAKLAQAPGTTSGTGAGKVRGFAKEGAR